MSDPSEKIIADPARSPTETRLPLWLAGLAIGWGLAAALVYWHQGLTLSHYDAKGHLVVSRRVLDSLTPGWLQLGAVWLPLPHLLNLLPVPLLDGGPLMYYTVEVFKGSPVSDRAIEIGQHVGIALLFTLMAFALYNDLKRLLAG